MGTPSTIAVVHADGKVSQCYCTYDGYLKGVGKMLLKHYTTLEQVEELVALGDLSIVGKRAKPIGQHSFDYPEEGTTIAYGRDRREQNVRPNVYRDAEMYRLTNDFADYNYLFQDGEWFRTNKGGKVLLTELYCGVDN